MTKKELIDAMEAFDDDTPVVLSDDGREALHIYVTSKPSHLGTKGFNPSNEDQTAIYLHHLEY